MKASELRIGNLISHKDGTIMPIEWVTSLSVTLTTPKGGNWSFMLDEVEPILINVDLLEMLGFDLEDMADLGVHFSLKISDELFLTYNEKSIWIGEYDTKSVYLHQLQNLYFALTGKELSHSA